MTAASGVVAMISLAVLCVRSVDRDELEWSGDMHRRIAAVSALISGWVAIVLAINNNGVAAGVLLIGSALAFGSVLFGTSQDRQR